MLYERKRCVAVRGCAFGSRAVLPSQLYEIPILINIPIVNSGSCHDRRSQREVTRHSEPEIAVAAKNYQNLAHCMIPRKCIQNSWG
jgi:hypothetical protein